MRLSLTTRHRKLVITTGDDADTDMTVIELGGSFDPAPDPDDTWGEPEPDLASNVIQFGRRREGFGFTPRIVK